MTGAMRLLQSVRGPGAVDPVWLLLIVVVLTLSVWSGFAQADYARAKRAYDSGDYATAMKECAELAQSGDPGCQNVMGALYLIGKAVNRDASKALALFHSAYDHGFTRAGANIGWAHATGQGVPTSPDRAREILQGCYEKGEPACAYVLGDLYQSGYWGSEAKPRAIAWFLRAAHLNDREAMYRLGRMFENGDDVPRDYAKARAWYLQAAELGSTDAELKIGSLYAIGAGVPQNNDEAIAWWKRAALHGSTMAQYRLAHTYRMGNRTARDLVHAYAWLLVVYEKGFGSLKKSSSGEMRELQGEMSDDEVGRAIALARDWESQLPE